MEIKTSYASLGGRTTAFILDYILIAGYLLLVVGAGQMVIFFSPSYLGAAFGSPLSAQFFGFLTVTLPVSLYYIFCESSAGQGTWGKRKMGLYVTDTEGARLTLLRACGRTFLKFVPWELAHTCIWQINFTPEEPSPFITGGFVLVWLLVGLNLVWFWKSQKHQTLYDRLAGTCVVMR